MTTMKCVLTAVPPGCVKPITFGEFDDIESARKVKQGAKILGYKSITIGVAVFENGEEIDNYALFDVVLP